MRVYLTKLREEAYIDLKPGVVDTGASGNEMRLTYSAYTLPRRKRRRNLPAPASAAGEFDPSAPDADGRRSDPSATAPRNDRRAARQPLGRHSTAPASRHATGKQRRQKVQKPGKKEKIRFGRPRANLLLPRRSPLQRSLRSDTNPSVTTPDTRYVNPDGTVSSTAPAANERKTRLSNRPPVKKVKKDKSDPNAPRPRLLKTWRRRRYRTRRWGWLTRRPTRKSQSEGR